MMPTKEKLLNCASKLNKGRKKSLSTKKNLMTIDFNTNRTVVRQVNNYLTK